MEFVLNNNKCVSTLPSGMTILDFIRYQKHLKGTKIGCREGDCGACTILIGELVNGELIYKTITSCISPLGNGNGKHIVTVEGLKLESLNPVQEAMKEAGATQCGFCTVGFVMSLIGFCLSDQEVNYQNVIAAVDGNICRCTGYKSIERAIKVVVDQLKNRNDSHIIPWLIQNRYIPEYFRNIKAILGTLNTGPPSHGNVLDLQLVGGGTDLYVQQHEKLADSQVHLLNQRKERSPIVKQESICTIGGTSTVTDLMESDVMNNQFPRLKEFLKLVSSTQIRNMATVSGNLVNASPIGDLTIFLLALDATISLVSSKGERNISLKEFYKGYKDLDKESSEIITQINYRVFDEKSHFNFEKVSKRRYLDIASVNSAIQIEVSNNSISKVHLSAGGVSPIPLYLTRTCDFLSDKELNSRNIIEAAAILNSEISPISDARGTADYKRLLLRQLFFAHFIEMFPDKFEINDFVIQAA